MLDMEKSELIYKNLVENVNDIIFSLDEKGNFIAVNNRIRSYGYEPEEVIGSHFATILTSPEKQYFTDLFEQIKKSADNPGFSFETEILKKENTIIVVELSISSEYKGSELIGVYGVARDITERKKAIAELVKFSAAVEQSPSAIAITNNKGEIQYVNPKFSEITGYSAEEAMGKLPSVLEAGNLPGPVYKKLWESVTSGKTWRGEFHNETRKGNPYWEEVLVSPIFSDSGEITHFIKIAEDITLRKQSEQVHEILYKIARKANEVNTLEELLIVIRTELGKLFDTTNFDTSFYVPGNETMRSSIISDDRQQFSSVPASGTLAKLVVDSGEPLLVGRSEILNRKKEGSLKINGDIPETWMGVPLNFGIDTKGVMVVQSYSNPNAFSDNDKELFLFISEQVGVFIENIKTKEDLNSAKEIAEKSEQKYRAYIEQSSEGIYRLEVSEPMDISMGVDEQVDYLYDHAYLAECNLRFARMYGIEKPEHLIGTRLYEFHGGKNHPVNRKEMHDLITSGYRIVNRETEEKSIDGNTRIFSNNTVGLVENGKLTRLWGTQTDITEQKILYRQLSQAKEEAEESERRHRSVLKTAINGYWLVDRTGGFIEVNEAYCRMSGYSEKELLGMKIQDVEAIEDPHEIGKHILDVVNKGEARFESVHRRKDGSLFDVEVVVQSRGDGQMVSFLSDITKRKKNEQELIDARVKAEQNEAQLLDSQRVARLGYYVFDIRNDKWTSSEMLDEIFGIGKTYKRDAEGWLDIVHPEFRLEMGQYLANNIIKEKENFKREYKIVNQKDKSVLWVSGLGELELNKNGKPVKLYGTIQDITERKNIMEELVAARNKAEESDRLKSAFLANMSHEFRTPMNGILGFLEILSQPGLDEEDKSGYIQVINKSGERLMDTINDIIEISKIEVGDIILSDDDVNITELMQYYHDFFKPQAEEKGVSLTITRQIDGNDAYVKTDKHKLDSILINLLKNAVKFTEHGKIEFGNYLEDGNLCFFVTDTGKGISEDKIEIIFDRFVQAELALTRGYEGSGIGLSIVKAYLDELGGTINVESKLGKGSTFLISIPYKTVTGKKARVKKEVPVRELSTRCLILVAEDEKVN